MGKHGMDCEPGHQPQKAFLQEKCILIAPKLNFYIRVGTQRLSKVGAASARSPGPHSKPQAQVTWLSL